jgi:hypothetical protein
VKTKFKLFLTEPLNAETISLRGNRRQISRKFSILISEILVIAISDKIMLSWNIVIQFGLLRVKRYQKFHPASLKSTSIFYPVKPGKDFLEFFSTHMGLLNHICSSLRFQQVPFSKNLAQLEK